MGVQRARVGRGGQRERVVQRRGFCSKGREGCSKVVVVVVVVVLTVRFTRVSVYSRARMHLVRVAEHPVISEPSTAHSCESSRGRPGPLRTSGGHSHRNYLCATTVMLTTVKNRNCGTCTVFSIVFSIFGTCRCTTTGTSTMGPGNCSVESSRSCAQFDNERTCLCGTTGSWSNLSMN